MNQRNKCYNCKYRGTVPGSAHSSCNHPTVKKMLETNYNPLIKLISILKAGVLLIQPAGMNIKANEHGLRSGWFNFPWDFDPVWLENCDGFTPKENENKSDI